MTQLESGDEYQIKSSEGYDASYVDIWKGQYFIARFRYRSYQGWIIDMISRNPDNHDLETGLTILNNRYPKGIPSKHL